MSGIRYVVAIVVAVAVTLTAFFVMHKLIATGGDEPDVKDRPPSIRFAEVDIPDSVETKQRRKPPEPPPPEEPPPPPEMELESPEPVVQDMPNMDMPSLDVPMSGTGGPFLGSMGRVDRNEEGDVIPLVKIQPQYPREAAIRRLEGWVRVEFTITPAGTVTDPTVVDADPPRVFNRSALRAILKWKFKPRVIDGQAVARRATQTIEFNLEDAQG